MARPAASAKTPTSGSTRNAMQFQVHAIDRRQQVVSLTLEAVSEAAAAEAARLKGLTVFSIRATRQVLSWTARKARFPTLLFTLELAALLDAGLNLVEALSTLAEKGRESPVLAG